MLPGRCSLELSDRKLHRKIKSHKLRAKPTCPGLPWRALQFRGPSWKCFLTGCSAVEGVVRAPLSNASIASRFASGHAFRTS